MAEFYVPRTKLGLVSWLYTQTGYDKNSLRKLSKEQLFAIFYKVRKNYDKAMTLMPFSNFTTAT